MPSRPKIGRSDTIDTMIPVNDDKKSDKIGSNVIECSVNMNVSLSRANKRSKLFQRAQSLFIVILAVIFAIVFSHLKREVRALEVQMNCVNTNLMMLMLRYDKLNKNFNRIWYHRLDNHQHHRHHRFLHDTMDHSTRQLYQSPSRHRHSFTRDEISIYENIKKAHGTTIISNSAIRRNSTYGDEKASKKMSNGSVPENYNNLDDDNDDDGTTMDDGDYKESYDGERYERAAVVAFERRNHEMTTVMTGSMDDQSDDTNTWNESRTGRYRRDEGRGPLIATFVGAVPEQHVTDTVYVGPWVKSTRNESRYAFNKFHLVENRTSIEVTANGLYMISAQIYYFGKPTHYSYWILLSSEGTSSTRKVIKCATVSAVSTSDASCYTSVVLPLRKGDRLHIEQQERDRLINLREGHSYVQIILLSSETPRRRGS